MIFNEDYAKFYDMLYSDKDYTSECNFLEEVFKRYSKIPVRSILDVGCGTGNHAAELIKRGYDVVGVEPSEPMASFAVKKGIDVVLGKVLDLPNFNNKFDAVISMFTVIGYIHDTNELIDTFKWIRQHTNHLFIFDFWNGNAVLTQKPTIGKKRISDEYYRVKYPKLITNDHVVRVKQTIYDNSDNIIVEEEHVVRYYFPREIEHYLNDAGFRLIGLFPCWRLDRDIRDTDWDIVAVAEVI